MKRTVDDLAVFGGEPEFPEPLHVGRPGTPDVELFVERVRSAFARRRYTNDGPFVHEFEQRLAATLGVKHCVATCNGTVALEIAIRALNLTGEVIVPSFTFVATAHALRWLNITPVFCDVDPATHTIDPHLIETLITPLTTAIMGVHLWGHACDVEALTSIATRHRLKLLFDAAHAFACRRRQRCIGGFGDAEVFSFHATKCLTTFEGGAITTNSDDVAERVRLMRSFGFVDYDRVESLGTNGKLHEISAAMGLSSLDGLAARLAQNERNHRCYGEQLRGIDGIRLVRPDDGDGSNYHYVVIEVSGTDFGLNRDALHRVLWAEGVLARRYFHPGCHRVAPHDAQPLRRPLPQTERLCETVLCLPTGETVSEDDVRRVCQLVRFAHDHRPHITQRRLARLESSGV
jgi:dTDP-4-amino-4,6-dideoxygalactose transaminase